MTSRIFSLVAVLGAMAVASVSVAQEAGEPEPDLAPRKTAFVAGEFVTQDDFGHISDALGYLNLTPDDFQFEKKHLDHRFRLPAVNAAVDNPMGLPKTAEAAAYDFRRQNHTTTKTLAAAKLLGLDEFAWSVEGLRKGEEKFTSLFAEANRLIREAGILDVNGDKKQAALTRLKSNKVTEEMNRYTRDLVFGGKVAAHSDARGFEKAFADSLNARSTEFLKTVGGTLELSDGLTADEAIALAGQMPSLNAEGEIAVPGTSYVEPTPAILETAQKCKLSYSFVAGARLSAILEQQAFRWNKIRRGVTKTVPAPEGFGITGQVVLVLEGPNGLFVIGGAGPNTYSGDNFIGIIDIGGNDVYSGRVAGGIGLPGQPAFSFVLDLEGNDQYLGEDFTQGFGFNGVGILHDLGKGNDVYRSRFCSQGAGLCGYGELYDDGGDDIYTADSFTQGAGSFGYGQLTDASGNDTYRACRYSQAFAQVMGVGVLTDGDGNDTYYAGGRYLHQPLFEDRYQSLSQGFAIGNRRWGETGGGIALLLDSGDGNDTYTADIYGQGSSYWYSLGMLVDEGGNDVYTLGQYGQGAGIHLSAGILVDLKGDDAYTNPYGVGTGGAHDWSVGWLIDRAGNDSYTGNGQGQGLNFSTAVLLDCAGNDTHISAHKGNIGQGKNNSVSLLIDLDGGDTYGPKELTDNSVVKRGAGALVYDCRAGWFVGIDESTLPTVQKEPIESATVQHILIQYKSAEHSGATRSKAEAETLIKALLKQARTLGTDWTELQKKHNEDSIPAADYVVTPEAGFVAAFKETGLRLGVGQIGICESMYGFHILRRMK
ncbi:peptidylprolyl isomerase [Planctomycetota bacterium]|nr:peptidylprolyl isomerase [Planctomycetota bacterium]